jgi:hypothetical protein
MHVLGRREGGGRGDFPGPLEIFFMAPVIFLLKYFRAKGKIFGFFGQSNEILYEKLRKVAGKQLQRTRPEQFLP